MNKACVRVSARGVFHRNICAPGWFPSHRKTDSSSQEGDEILYPRMGNMETQLVPFFHRMGFGCLCPPVSQVVSSPLLRLLVLQILARGDAGCWCFPRLYGTISIVLSLLLHRFAFASPIHFPAPSLENGPFLLPSKSLPFLLAPRRISEGMTNRRWIDPVNGGSVSSLAVRVGGSARWPVASVGR